jgi:hypothetical protein
MVVHDLGGFQKVYSFTVEFPDPNPEEGLEDTYPISVRVLMGNPHYPFGFFEVQEDDLTWRQASKGEERIIRQYHRLG